MTASLRRKWNAKARLWVKPTPKPKPTHVKKGKAQPRKLLPAETLWGAGGPKGPCSTEILGDTVNRHRKPLERGAWNRSGNAESLPGPISVSDALGKRTAKDMMINDPQPRHVKLPKLDVQRFRTCWQLHGGVCRTFDEQLLPHILRVCCNLNTIFSKFSKWGSIGRCWRLAITKR